MNENPKPHLLDLYEKMITIRIVEERLQKLCDEGLAGDLHFSKGQEAIAVGVCAALESTDHIVTHHRTIAHEIARGADLFGLISEVLGKMTGFNVGRAGEMHISNPTIRHDFSFQLVGTCIPVAAGLAWALKNHHKKDEIVVCFFGDAATANGQFHEGVNIAAIHQLPLLLICENNWRAGNITQEHYIPPGMDLIERIHGYGITGSTVDGNDLGEVMLATQDGAEAVRKEGGPHMIVFNTQRLCWHKQGQRDIRSKEELAELAKDDPILRVESELHADDESFEPEKIGYQISLEIDEAIKRALGEPPSDYY